MELGEKIIIWRGRCFVLRCSAECRGMKLKNKSERASAWTCIWCRARTAHGLEGEDMRERQRSQARHTSRDKASPSISSIEGSHARLEMKQSNGEGGTEGGSKICPTSACLIAFDSEGLSDLFCSACSGRGRPL